MSSLIAHNRVSKMSSGILALVVVIAGLIVTLGWMLDIAALKSIMPTWVTMKANTAFGFLFGGFSLWTLTQ